MVRVDIVKDLVCVFLFTCRENYDFIPLNQLLKNILHVGAQPDLNFCPFEPKLESWFESGWDVTFEFSSNERLIHIEDK